jgi:signal transduction histidine kinase
VIEIGRAVIDLEKLLAQQRGVALTFHDVPPILAHVDSRIHRVIQILVRNGLEAAHYGGLVGLWITAGGDSTVHIRVTDDGGGIDRHPLRRHSPAARRVASVYSDGLYGGNTVHEGAAEPLRPRLHTMLLPFLYFIPRCASWMSG